MSIVDDLNPLELNAVEKAVERAERESSAWVELPTHLARRLLDTATGAAWEERLSDAEFRAEEAEDDAGEAWATAEGLRSKVAELEAGTKPADAKNAGLSASIEKLRKGKA